MTRFKCNKCEGMGFSLTGGRLSMTVEVICTDCQTTVAEFSRMNFTQ